ncbi:hypothetical protein [Prevotella sp.]|uniref:hypothetical protein n=1 Tax=Prevotella sp. TaxID=59823 RepID=UPI0025DD0E82|nr:hypothetical protein [Prevotella sp.]
MMSSNIFFQPFVGKDYANGGIFGKRIMILGESHYCDEGCCDCGNLWNSVVFFNYLQVAMGGPREAGTSAQYRQAGDALFDVMDKYQPEYVIAWGKRLWSNMPGERWREGEDIVVDGYHVATGAYFLSNGRQVKVMAVNHPSVGYPWDYWNRVIQDLLLL